MNADKTRIYAELGSAVSSFCYGHSLYMQVLFWSKFLPSTTRQGVHVAQIDVTFVSVLANRDTRTNPGRALKDTFKKWKDANPNLEVVSVSTTFGDKSYVITINYQEKEVTSSRLEQQ